MFELRMETGGAAFEPDPAAEIARILRALADKVETYGITRSTATVVCSEARPLLDLNGNRVGDAAWKVCAVGCMFVDGHPGACFPEEEIEDMEVRHVGSV